MLEEVGARLKTVLCRMCHRPFTEPARRETGAAR
ncbi:hypothetical protein BH24ACT23_BH24ACT23_08000 [soil metagenome]